MNEATLAQILELATGKTEAAEVYYLSSQDTPVEFENNRLKSLQSKATQGVALRVICGGRLGFASSTDLTRLEELVAAALQTAEISEPVEEEFATNSQLTSPPSDFNPPTTQELVAIGEKWIDQVHEYSSDILVDASFHIRSSQVELATSSHVYTQRSRKLVSASLSGNLVQGEDFLQAYSYDVARDDQPNYDRILHQLLQKYRQAERQSQIISGSYPVFFTPRAASSTFGRLLKTILSGQAVVQLASPLAERVGDKLFDQRLTVLEDPSLGPFACAFDDEGTPTTQKRFIDQGVVEQFYWDRRWAARARPFNYGKWL